MGSFLEQEISGVGKPQPYALPLQCANWARKPNNGYTVTTTIYRCCYYTATATAAAAWCYYDEDEE